MSELGFDKPSQCRRFIPSKSNWKISWDMFTRMPAGHIEYDCRLWGLASLIPPGQVVTAIFGSFERDGRHVLYTVYADDDGRPDGNAAFQQSHMVDDINFLLSS